ncbi:MAG: pyridoxal-phosphate dependent enzyme [Anaerolineae bacterium]
MQIQCSECSAEAPAGALGRCPNCSGILRPQYPEAAVRRLAGIEPGPGIDRYRALLPVETALPYLGEGDTPLVASRRLGPALGLDRLFFKHEGCNPSGAFKDRAGALVAALALEAGAAGVLTASSGNAAAAISAYCAAAGLKCLILLEPDNPPAKLRQALATGAEVLPVAGIFAHGPEAVAGLILAVAGRLNYYPAFVWAPVNPYILEGIKTISYEIVARLPGPPDFVVCPVGGGDMLAAQWRGYQELRRAGVIDRRPRMIAVQSSAAPPLLEAFRAGAERVDTLPAANSRISGINVPFSGEHALAAVRESGGWVAGVSDEAVFAMQHRLAVEEGLWVEPVSAATVAALPDLLAGGQIKPGERGVCILSGAGFKDQHLAGAEALAVGGRAPVAFDAEAVVQALAG